jgi:hypothetical protein
VLTGDHSSASRRVRISRPSRCTTSIPARGEQLSGRGSVQKIHWTNPTTQKKKICWLECLEFSRQPRRGSSCSWAEESKLGSQKSISGFQEGIAGKLKNPGKMEGGHWATRVPDVLLHHTQGCPCTCTGEASSLMRRWSPSLWTWKCLNMLGK